jgi:hypothetical protein
MLLYPVHAQLDINTDLCMHNWEGTQSGLRVLRTCTTAVLIQSPAATFGIGAMMVAKLRQRDPPLCQLATTTSSFDASCQNAHRLSVPDS